MKILGLLLLLNPLSGWGFTLIGTHSSLGGWGTKELQFSVNYEHCPMGKDHLNELIDGAMEIWNGVSTSGIRLKRVGESYSSVSAASRGNIPDFPVILCDPEMSKTLGVETNNIPGVGIVGIENSQINYGYFLLNAEAGKGANIGKLSEDKLRVVLAHEIGHILGLGHSGDSSALMYFDATDKKVLNLSQDDMDGITYLYPRQEPDQSRPAACGTLQNVSGGQGPGLMVGWILFFIFLKFIANYGLKTQGLESACRKST